MLSRSGPLMLGAGQGLGGALVLAHLQGVELQAQLVQQALVEGHFGPDAGQQQHAGRGHERSRRRPRPAGTGRSSAVVSSA